MMASPDVKDCRYPDRLAVAVSAAPAAGTGSTLAQPAPVPTAATEPVLGRPPVVPGAATGWVDRCRPVPGAATGWAAH